MTGPSERRPRRLSPRALRWLMNLYPPLLFAGVRWRAVSEDCLQARIVVLRRLLNRNLNGTLFGGAISSAADPALGILLWQALARRGRAVEGWTARFEVEFLRPGRSDLTLDLAVAPSELEAIEASLAATGRGELESVVEARDTQGEVCARFRIVTVVRDPAVRRALAAQANQ